MALESNQDLGQRRLAAIVFTDVVGFSARMQENETDTLRLVERDSQFIKSVCETFHGRILKSTGDGLLMFFDSAVDAVAAALKIQQELGQLPSTLPQSEVLVHRIGIHLGDVFIRDGDVMGDGVNVAARLQAEAQPGGICISQTVYEVVKNKISLQVTSLGPRELKNIREAVPAYQILIHAHQALDAPSGRRASERAGRGRAAWVVGIAVVVLVAAAAGFWYARHDRAANTARVIAPSTPPAEIKPVVPEQPPVSLPPAAPEGPVPPSPAYPQPPSPESQPPGRASSFTPAPPLPEPPAPPEHALRMSTRWIQGEMFRYSKDKRLTVVPPPRLASAASNLPPTTAWMEGTTLHFDVGGKDTPSDLSRAPTIVLEYVLYSLTQANPSAVPDPIRRIFGGGPPPGPMDAGGQPGFPPQPPR